MSRVLPVLRQLEILGQLASIAEKGEVYAMQLIDCGFSAFFPWQNFDASFCENAESETHRRYAIEVAKICLGSPHGPSGYLAHLRPDAYRSDFIERLRAERDARNGVPFKEIPENCPWCRELDPCASRKSWFIFNEPTHYNYRRREMVREHRLLRQQEANMHATGLGQGVEDTPLGWAQFLVAAFDVYLTPLGFLQDRHRSRTFLPVYSKRIAPGWDLCFSLESRRNIELHVRNYSEERGAWTPLEICLDVRAEGRKQRAPFRIGTPPDVLDIRYHYIVNGFGWAYGYFTDLDSFECSIKAYAHFYSFIQVKIEDTLRRELG
jgi:hypothetical protein